MATSAQDKPETQLLEIAKQINSHLAHHLTLRPRTADDVSFLRKVRSCLAHAPALIATFHQHRPDLQPAIVFDEPNRYEAKYPQYIHRSPSSGRDYGDGISMATAEAREVVEPPRRAR
ncbi:hypothetical protein OHC33_002758 [Knufia fluminis]|uniref:Uncharacterized protein n=1 Tax=Knufia fluminis TaxID=191047 RepID=A0AAN8EI34_9EURO|nr:hypothetical protein OHC33_002758 [Knufia fluminis]